MVTPVDSNASTAVIFLFSSPFVTISGSSSDWLASSTAALLVSITSGIFLLLVSCLHSTISGSIADNDVTTSMSKLMYHPWQFQKKVDHSIPETLHQSASIWLYFKKNTTSTRVPLLAFEKHKSKNRKIARKGNGSQRD